MILEQVSLRNWRAYRGDGHTFAFGDHANLLVGPNESGKSSVLEAVRRGLLDRHTARGKDILAVRPLGSSLGPEVRLVFRANDGEGRERRYTSLKRFLDNAAAEVRVERDGEFQLDHEGDAADRFLRALVGADDATRGTLKPEQRGLAQALWFLQREEGIPNGRWNDALETNLKDRFSAESVEPNRARASGIRSLLSAASSSAQAEAVEERVNILFDGHFTPTGRIKTKSELAILTSTIESLKQELEQRNSERDRAALHREELGQIEQEDRSLVDLLADCEAQRKQLTESLQIEPELTAGLNDLERRTEAARRRCAETSARRQSVAVLDQRIQELDETLRDGEEALARLRIAVREHRRSAERHARSWEDELSPKLEAVRQGIADLQAKQRIEQLEIDVQRLDEQLERRRTLSKEVAEAKARLSSVVIVDEASWDRVRSLSERAAVLRDRVWAAGMRVQASELPAGTLTFDPEPEVDTANNELVIAQETVVGIEGVGSFTLRSADERLAAFDVEARACRAELSLVLERFGASDEAALLILRERSVQMERELERAQDLLAAIAEGEDQENLTARRAATATELQELRERCPQSVLPGMEGWAEQRTQDELAELQEKAQSLERTIREEREAEQEAQQKSLEAHERLAAVSASAAAGNSERSALRERLASELEAFVDRAAFELAAATALREAEELDQKSSALRQRFAAEVKTPRKQLQRIEIKISRTEERHQQLAARRTDRRARLEEAGALSLDRQIAELETRLASAEQRFETVHRRAQAIAVLRRLFGHRREAQSHSWVEPVSQLVESWLVRLSEGRAVGVSFDTDLVPQGVALDGHEESLPFASLSHGAREQLVVLLRLALGVVLSQHTCQLVVLDDRLVNADSTRSIVMSEIINEAARSCQVLVATCRPEAYETVVGKRIDVARRGGFLAAAEAH